MASPSDLIQNVTDYFQGVFKSSPASVSSGGGFLAFEKCGVSISPAMFRLPATPTAFSPALAIEQVSELVNTIPTFGDGAFQRSGRTVEDQYELILGGAQPSSATATAVFSPVKTQAARTFDNLKVGSLLLSAWQFHPCLATPSDWFDATNEGNWSSYNSDTSKSSTTGESSGTPTGPPPTPKLQWYVVPSDRVTLLERPDVFERHPLAFQRAMAAESQTATQSVTAAESPTATQTVTAAEPATTTQSSMATESQTTIERAPALEALATRPMATEMQTSASERLSVRTVAESAIHTPVETVSAAAGRVSRETQLLTSDADVAVDPSPLVQVAQVSSPLYVAYNALQLTNETSKQDVTSSDLHVTFDYCMVTITRPWLSEAFLTAKGWYVPGYAAGELSATKGAADTGNFAVVPVAFIAVKNLAITANFSQQDTAAAVTSASLGPFSLVGRTFSQAASEQTSQLICVGVQIIAWICEAQTILPPDPAPVIA